MIQVTIKAVYKNIRYRLLEASDGNYYLLDTETYVLEKLFPFLILLLPRKVYLITEEEYNRLLVTVKPFEVDDRKLNKFPVLPLTILLSSIIPLNFLSLPSASLNQLYVIICLLMVLVFHYYARSNKNLIAVIKERKPVYYKLIRETKEILKSVVLLLSLLACLAIFSLPVLVANTGNLIFYILIAMFMFTYSLGSLSVIPYNATFYLK